MTEKCKNSHNYLYLGVRYMLSQYPLSGTGAHELSYYDYYFCPNCLKKHIEKLKIVSNSYSKPLFDATPLPEDMEK